MGGTAGLSEAEIKTVKHRQEYEKHLKAKEERLDGTPVSAEQDHARTLRFLRSSSRRPDYGTEWATINFTGLLVPVSGKSGSPKKGGRGGKGVWGSVEDDIAMELKA
eukprot:CAMPEP_0117657148 /NCGR_PEP_ID=MMETSP0804-20121206/5179_1 /TAXON_ID=1074897 /ORGANISM="Tetraselmis astigmatica, Strain CCMP880" /LENGTH=106 /DNA_ID=CAMNT_0005463589 /DNA_START=201 /DNA_END=522 /DNA_ORIENTATION=-